MSRKKIGITEILNLKRLRIRPHGEAKHIRLPHFFSHGRETAKRVGFMP